MPLRPTSLLRCLLLSALGALAARGGDARWVEVRSPHFRVVGDARAGDARDVAIAFEQMREVFHQGFPGLKVDPPQPLIIFALRDEASLKALLPWYWKDDDQARPEGVYFHRHDQDFAVVRADLWSRADRENHSLYHEFTHAILHLNFRELPTWLDEGLAEYYGDTVFGRSEVVIGKTNTWRLRFLAESQWLPLETLLRVDHQSPYYNEGLKASVFYAESWLLARYLLLDPEAQQKQLFQKYLQAWLATGDTGRAVAPLGDLGTLELKLKLYLNRKTHGYQRMQPLALDPEQALKARPMSPAEGLAEEGAFLVAIGRAPLGEPLVRQALQLEPGLGAAHTAAGFLALASRDFGLATQELTQAERLDAEACLPPFLLGEALLQHGEARAAVAELEKASRLQPGHAAVFDALAQARRGVPGQLAQAEASEKRACELDPQELRYLAALGDLFLADHKAASAQSVGTMLKRLAFTASDKALVASYQARLIQAGAGAP